MSAEFGTPSDVRRIDRQRPMYHESTSHQVEDAESYPTRISLKLPYYGIQPFFPQKYFASVGLTPMLTDGLDCIVMRSPFLFNMFDSGVTILFLIFKTHYQTIVNREGPPCIVKSNPSSFLDGI